MRNTHVSEAIVMRRFFGQGLTDGSLCGGVDDVVARFTNTSTAEAAQTGQAGLIFDVSNTADNGTRVGIRRRGIYTADYGISQAAASTLLCAITKNGTAFIAADPAMSAANENIVLAQQTSVRPAADTGSIILSATFFVGEIEAAAAGTPNGAIIRFLLSTAGGATPADATILDNANCFARITYLGDTLAQS